MPAEFEHCRKEGGRIKTISIDKNKYMHVCYDAEGHSYPGYVKIKKAQKQMMKNK